jgi:uncharacterized membrane protein
MSHRSWYHPLSVGRSVMLRPRVILAAGVGLAVLAAPPGSFSTNVRWVAAWDAGAIVYLLISLWLMRCPPGVIRKRAARQDEGRVVVLAVVLLATTASFAAIGGVLGDARNAEHGLKLALLGLSGATILLSWLVTQIAFTFHYAHDYYRPDDTRSDAAGGLAFPGCEDPDYWDFLYFAVSVGACQQTSDVAIRSRALRRLVTAHALVAFVFNIFVLALTVNLAAGLIG